MLSVPGTNRPSPRGHGHTSVSPVVLQHQEEARAAPGALGPTHVDQGPWKAGCPWASRACTSLLSS